MPTRRVKTPWIEALTRSREEARAAASGMKSAQHGATQESAKVDLTPKRMADSFHNVVCHPVVVGVMVVFLMWYTDNG